MPSWDYRPDEVGAFTFERLADEVVLAGGEVAVVVVDVDEVDIVAFLRLCDEPDQRIDDVGDALREFFGILVPVAVEHVDDEQSGVTHESLVPATGL